MRWTSLITGVALAALSAGGCSREESGGATTQPAAATDKSRYTLGVAMMLNHPYWTGMEQGARDEAAAWEKEHGFDIDVILTDAREDAQLQITQIRQLIASGADGVMLVPAKPEPLVDGVLELNRKQIPVVLVNRPIGEGCDYVTYCGTDTKEGAKVSARILMEAIGGEGEVAELQQIPGSGPQILRSAALDEVLEEFPKVTLVARQSHGLDRTKTIKVTQALLPNHPDLKGLYVHGDLFAIAASEVARQLDRKIAIVGMGGSREALEAIRDGRITGTSMQQPYQEGRMGIRLLLRHLRGEQLDKSYPLVPVKVTAANAGEMEGQF